MIQRASSLARYTAALLAVLWACQPLGALLHQREEHAHRYCPQHQTFEESVKGTGLTQSRLAAERGPELASLPGPGTDSSRPTHESCPLLGSGVREQLPASDAVPLVLAHLEVSRPATAPPRVHPPLPILATAPKASPPARV